MMNLNIQYIGCLGSALFNYSKNQQKSTPGTFEVVYPVLMHRYGMLDRPDRLFAYGISLSGTTINRYSIERGFQLSIQLQPRHDVQRSPHESVVNFLSHLVDEHTT
jgi:hypothetical protein